jgi:cbb3-type cytochrome oxidase maturation protein
MIAKYGNESTHPAQPSPPAPPPPDRPPMSRAARRFLWVFSVAMIVTAGTAFIFKLIEFSYTALSRGSESLASFLIPVLTYLVVAAGFFCLFLWAYVSGQFRDIERPKYRMLEMQDEIDAAG